MLFRSQARWKVRELLDANGAAAGEAVRWFCADACWDTWKVLVGDVGRAAVRAGEDTLSRAAKVGRRDVERGTEQKEDDVAASTNEEIEEAWAKGFLAGQETVRRRTTPRRAGEGAWRQRPQDALLSSDDPDVFRLLISGITERFHASTNPLPSTWTSLTSLVPSLATNARALESNIRMYNSLIAILPLALLPYTTPLTILALLSRDNGNSFGIWSATHDDGSGERGELLAYGIYPSSSYFNHSCRPNLVKSRNGAAFEFRSGAEGVAQGDEVCISYLGGGEVGDREERRNRLMIGWGFWCEIGRASCRERVS